MLEMSRSPARGQQEPTHDAATTRPSAEQAAEPESCKTPDTAVVWRDRHSGGSFQLEQHLGRGDCWPATTQFCSPEENVACGDGDCIDLNVYFFGIMP